MAATSLIQWTDHTGGPFLGCSIVSAGCGHCYAKELAEGRLSKIFRNAYQKAGFEDWETRPVWGTKATRVLTKGFWNEARAINARHANAGTRGRWFPSQIDWLDDMPGGIIDQDGKQLDPIRVLADFLKLIQETPNLDWLLLTKRPENWSDRIAEAMGFIDRKWIAGEEARTPCGVWVGRWLEATAPHRGMGAIPDNVRFGFSAENQDCLDRRWEAAKQIPAKVTFISAEPLLSALDFRRVFAEAKALKKTLLIIVGGESGNGARRCLTEWIYDIVLQCRSAGVEVFVKQLGAYAAAENANVLDWPDDTAMEPDGSGAAGARILLRHPKGGDMNEWPEDLRVRQFPEISLS